MGGWMDGYVSSDFFQIATLPTGFLRFPHNLAHMIYVPLHTKLWNRFSKFCCY